MHKFARDSRIEIHAPKGAVALKGIAEQQQIVTRLKDTMLQSLGDMVDFQKADELIAAAAAEWVD